MTTGLGALVRQPLWRRWTAASFLGRLPMTMTLLALILVGEEATGSLAIGAQLAGVATFTAGITAPLRGRQLDRGGLREGLRNGALLTAVVLVAMAGAVILDLPVWVLFALAAAQGTALAALSGGFRALLVPVVSAEDLPRANTLEAVFIEVAFVAGPSLAGVLAMLVGPVGVLLAMAGAAGGAAVLVMTLPPVTGSAPGETAAPWRTRGAMPVYLIAMTIGVTFGLLESALAPRVEELGLTAASAGPLLALTAAGSALGGVFAALRRDHRRHQVRIAVALLASFGVLMAAVASSGSVLVLAVLLFAVGIPIAPLNALGALRLQDVLPVSRLGEGFALYTAAILVGAGLGQSITGQLLDDVGAQALLMATGAVPAAVAVVVTGRVATSKRRRAAAAAAVSAAQR